MYLDGSLSSFQFIRRHIGIPICIAGIALLTTSGLYAENGTLPRSAIIVPKSAGASPTEIQPESFESYQIRLLRNQNNLQAEKIKALREEVAEATRKLHELKPHLFTQGHPEDQAKI